MTFNIAFFADSHLGYRARVKNNDRGVNIIVQDGYDALRDIIKGILTNDVPIDAVVHGGDFSHTSQPSVRDVATGNFYLRKLADAGIPFYGVGGNHDSSDITSELPAVAAFHDPDRNIHMVYEPYKKFEIADGILLHAMSHHGLHANEAPNITVKDDVLNIFTTHGAAIDPKNHTLLRCVDSPREQIIPVELITDEMFLVNLLGHYHSRYAVGNAALNTWYAGSAIRRGFSDEPGPRGWLLIQIEANGQVTVTPKDIKQRPQYDLPVIDASDRNASDIMDMLEANLERTHTDRAPIVRQQIKNANRVVKEGLDFNRIDELRKHTLSWDLKFTRSENIETTEGVKATLSNERRKANDIIDNYKRFTEKAALKVPEQHRTVVLEAAENYLKQARDLSELQGGH